MAIYQTTQFYIFPYSSIFGQCDMKQMRTSRHCHIYLIGISYSKVPEEQMPFQMLAGCLSFNIQLGLHSLLIRQKPEIFFFFYTKFSGQRKMALRKCYQSCSEITRVMCFIFTELLYLKCLNLEKRKEKHQTFKTPVNRLSIRPSSSTWIIQDSGEEGEVWVQLPFTHLFPVWTTLL